MVFVLLNPDRLIDLIEYRYRRFCQLQQLVQLFIAAGTIFI